MGVYTLYRAYYKQRRPSGSTQSWQTVLPMEISYTDGSGHTTVIEENSTHCGYVPPVEPQYRWVNIPINQDYQCDTTTYTKYYKQKKQASYDNGATWNDVSPAEYQRGAAYETNSTDCGYIAPTGNKAVGHITDNSYDKTVVGTASIPCNASPTLSQSEVLPYHFADVIIGDCVTEVGYRAFYDNDGTDWNNALSSVTFPETLITIGKQAFWDNEDLTDVVFPDSLQYIGEYAFEDCMVDRAIIGPNIKSIGYHAFGWYDTLDEWMTPSDVYIYSQTPPFSSITDAFGSIDDNRDRFKCYVLPNAKPAFDQTAYPSYESNIIPLSGNHFDKAYLQYYSDGEYTTKRLYNSSGSVISSSEISPAGTLKYAYIGSGATSIGDNAFKGCSILEYVYINDTVTSIGNWAFSGCTSIADVTLPDSITSIGAGAFADCTSITSINIPSGVTSIGNGAFSGCSAFDTLTFASTVPPTIGAGAFDDTNGCIIDVPLESLDAYKAAWPQYADRIDVRGMAILYYRIGFGTYTYLVPYREDGEIEMSDVLPLAKEYRVTGATITKHTDYIGSTAFAPTINYLSGLSTVEISSSVDFIGEDAFFNGAIGSITIHATIPPTLSTRVFGDDIHGDNYPIYVPAASVNTYKTQWSDYASRIFPISS